MRVLDVKMKDFELENAFTAACTWKRAFWIVVLCAIPTLIA